MVDQEKQSKTNHTSNLGKYIETGGPGRAKGSKNYQGFYTALQILAEIIEDPNNQKKLKEKFQELFDKNPVGFYVKIIAPVIPKTVNLTGESGDPLQFIITNRFAPDKNKNGSGDTK
jgi:hypothetical protein